MFTCPRLVEKICANDDSCIARADIQEAVDLCADATVASRLVRCAMGKLSNSFVVARLKALVLLFHLLRVYPAVIGPELRKSLSVIVECETWEGAPHPTRGKQPYVELRQLATQLGSVLRHEIDIQSVVLPCMAESESHFSRGSVSDSYCDGGYGGRSGAYGSAAYGSVSNDPHPGLSRDIGDVFAGIGDKIKSTFKRILPGSGRGDDFEEFDERQERRREEQRRGPPLGPGVPYRPGQASPESLLGGNDEMSRQAPRRGAVGVEPVRRVHLSPAQRLLKVTNGRALASAAELAAFKDAMSPEMADELTLALGDADWKVRVRAVLGLELLAGEWGLGCVVRAKAGLAANASAPQASLKAAAGKFYEQLKAYDPECEDAGAAKSGPAFAFITDGEARSDEQEEPRDPAVEETSEA